MKRLEKGLGRQLKVHGRLAPRLPNTLSVVFPGVNAQDLLRRIPNLAASTGSACHSTLGNPSSTLTAIGLETEAALGTMRLSVGWYTSQEEIELTAEWLIEAWESAIAQQN
ncbi:MAG: aminotransferase class V-fold PLP-dependent enzyme [Pirellulaceae bacterium]